MLLILFASLLATTNAYLCDDGEQPDAGGCCKDDSQDDYDADTINDLGCPDVCPGSVGRFGNEIRCDCTCHDWQDSKDDGDDCGCKPGEEWHKGKCINDDSNDADGYDDDDYAECVNVNYQKVRGTDNCGCAEGTGWDDDKHKCVPGEYTDRGDECDCNPECNHRNSQDNSPDDPNSPDDQNSIDNSPDHNSQGSVSQDNSWESGDGWVSDDWDSASNDFDSDDLDKWNQARREKDSWDDSWDEENVDLCGCDPGFGWSDDDSDSWSRDDSQDDSVDSGFDSVPDVEQVDSLDHDSGDDVVHHSNDGTADDSGNDQDSTDNQRRRLASNRGYCAKGRTTKKQDVMDCWTGVNAPNEAGVAGVSVIDETTGEAEWVAPTVEPNVTKADGTVVEVEVQQTRRIQPLAAKRALSPLNNSQNGNRAKDKCCCDPFHGWKDDKCHEGQQTDAQEAADCEKANGGSCTNQVVVSKEALEATQQKITQEVSSGERTSALLASLLLMFTI